MDADAAHAGSAGHLTEHEERDAITAALCAIDDRRARQSEQFRQSLARLDAVLAGLPPPFDSRMLSAAEAASERAVAAHSSAQQAHLTVLQQVQALAAARQQRVNLTERREAALQRAGRIENAVGDWTLFARCMSNDGLIALAIDDAGPSLSALANSLLLACYGPRFMVGILTQAETARGEKREDFDIVVHDAQSDERKSVRLMSGERGSGSTNAWYEQWPCT